MNMLPAITCTKLSKRFAQFLKDCIKVNGSDIIPEELDLTYSVIEKERLVIIIRPGFGFKFIVEIFLSPTGEGIVGKTINGKYSNIYDGLNSFILPNPLLSTVLAKDNIMGFILRASEDDSIITIKEIFVSMNSHPENKETGDISNAFMPACPVEAPKSYVWVIFKSHDGSVLLCETEVTAKRLISELYVGATYKPIEIIHENAHCGKIFIDAHQLPIKRPSREDLKLQQEQDELKRVKERLRNMGLTDDAIESLIGSKVEIFKQAT